MEGDETRAGWTSLVLLERFRGGDDPAAEALFARYFERLTLLARSRLSPRAGAPDRSGGHRAVGLSELLRRGARRPIRARPRRRSLAAAGVHHQAQAAPAGPTSDVPTAGRSTVECSLDQVDEGTFPRHEREPTPEEALALADELERVFAQLDPFGRRVLELRLQGSPIAEIAEDTGRRSARSGARWLRSVNSWPSDSTMTDDEFESRILRFEQAWRRDGPSRDRGFPG